jgi:uncharacterized SAM-binding protein YcdF (DUF218 family)
MRKAVIFFLILFLLYIYRYDILISYANYFQVDNAKKGADAIIVLAGNPSTRPHHAAMIYAQGYAKKIYITSPKEQAVKLYDFLLTQTKVYQKVLEANHIYDYEIIPSLKQGATSTLDEAYDSAYIFKDSDIKRIILVTDISHTKRAINSFKKVYSKIGMDHIIIESSAAKNAIYSTENWWQYESGIVDIFLETLKSAVYFFLDKIPNSIKES